MCREPALSVQEKLPDESIDTQDENIDVRDESADFADGSSFESQGRSFLRGSIERIPMQETRSQRVEGDSEDCSPSPVYVRAVNNHRSVIRPRDIKCKKFNKCLWKSYADCGQR